MTQSATNGATGTGAVFRRGAARGLVAGAVGVAVMTLAERRNSGSPAGRTPRCPPGHSSGSSAGGTTRVAGG